MYRLTWPNRITLTRIVLVVPFVAALLYLQEPRWGEFARWSAVVIFTLMAVSDMLDGYLARKLNEETAVGRFLDPVGDKVMILCSVILLAHEGTQVPGMLLPSWVALLAVAKDVIVVLGFCIVYLATGRIFIQPRPAGKWCTTVQLVMIIALLLSPSMPATYQAVPRALWWGASVLAVVAVTDYFQLARRFIAQQQPANAGETTSGGPPSPSNKP